MLLRLRPGRETPSASLVAHPSAPAAPPQNLWVADVSSFADVLPVIVGLRNPDGSRMIRARYPNANPEFGFGPPLRATSWAAPTIPIQPAVEIRPSTPNRTDSYSFICAWQPSHPSLLASAHSRRLAPAPCRLPGGLRRHLCVLSSGSGVALPRLRLAPSYPSQAPSPDSATLKPPAASVRCFAWVLFLQPLSLHPRLRLSLPSLPDWWCVRLWREEETGPRLPASSIVSAASLTRPFLACAAASLLQRQHDRGRGQLHVAHALWHADEQPDAAAPPL